MKKKIFLAFFVVIVIAAIFLFYVSQTEKGLFGLKTEKTALKGPESPSHADQSGSSTNPEVSTAEKSATSSVENIASQGPSQGEAGGVTEAEAAAPMIIDLDVLKNGKGGKLAALMAERKKRWGLKDSVDIIATGDEKVKVGDFEISLDTIKKNLQMSEGKIFVEDIDKGGAAVRKTLTYFGVRLVRPGDNLWDVHFLILKEYLAAKGLKVSPSADEPTTSGRSTGVGKVLKFAENMVMVFNLETKTPPNNLNLLRPGTEVVIFNFTPIFQLLNSIDFSKLDTIHFDGKTLYVEPV